MFAANTITHTGKQFCNCPMLSINEIKKPIAADIDAFEDTFKASMQSSVPLLDQDYALHC
jgi:hypothetical protein